MMDKKKGRSFGRMAAVISVGAILLAAAGLAGCASPKTNLKTLRLNEVAHSIFYAPQYVAMELGYFEDEGINLEVQTGFGADKSATAVISGDAADPMVLVQGHIVTAAQLMVIDIDPVKTLKIVEMAKQLNPELNIMARAGSRDEVEHLKQEGIANVYLDSESVSEVLTGNILDYYKKDEEQGEQGAVQSQSAH